MGCSSMKAPRKGSLQIPKNGILKKPSPNQSCQFDIIGIKKKTLSFQISSINSYDLSRKTLHTRQIISE